MEQFKQVNKMKTAAFNTTDLDKQETILKSELKLLSIDTLFDELEAIDVYDVSEDFTRTWIEEEITRRGYLY